MTKVMVTSSLKIPSTGNEAIVGVKGSLKRKYLSDITAGIIDPEGPRNISCTICGKVGGCEHITRRGNIPEKKLMCLAPEDFPRSADYRFSVISIHLAEELETYLRSTSLSFRIAKASNGLGIYLYSIRPKFLDRVILPELMRLAWRRGFVIGSERHGSYSDGVFLLVGSRYAGDIFHWRAEDKP
jgi:hypothetical protein